MPCPILVSPLISNLCFLLKKPLTHDNSVWGFAAWDKEKSHKNHFVNSKNMAFALLCSNPSSKILLSAYPFLSMPGCRWWTSAVFTGGVYSSPCFGGGHQLERAPLVWPWLRMQSCPAPRASQIPEASILWLPLYSALLLSFPISIFKAFCFPPFSFIPSPSFTTASNKKPITLLQLRKKAFEKGGCCGVNVPKPQNCELQTNKGAGWGYL